MTSLAYSNELDIANRALGHLGAPPIYSPSDNSKNNRVMSNLYHKMREFEMRRNVWRFTTRRCPLRPLTTTTMLFVPETWQLGNVYVQGALVNYNGINYISTISENFGNQPGQGAQFWECYFGPLTADVWNNPTSNPPAGTAYWMGELVYMPIAGPGGTGGADSSANALAVGVQVYSSRYPNNTDTPNVGQAWVATTVYNSDDVVLHSGGMWRSLIPNNTNNIPATAPAIWSPGITYVVTNTVTGGDGFVYQAVGTSQNVEPVNDAANNGEANWEPSQSAPYVNAWTQVPPSWVADTSWVVQNGTLVSIVQSWPVGAGPVTDAATRNIYRLPSGFLRQAPQDPKAGTTSFLGGPAGMTYSDWEYEGDYITTWMSGVLILRFAANITAVPTFDPMFCEGLALSMAIDACEDITQSEGKKQGLGAMYKMRMSEARMVNGIENSADAPPEDDYIACRV